MEKKREREKKEEGKRIFFVCQFTSQEATTVRAVSG